MSHIFALMHKICPVACIFINNDIDVPNFPIIHNATIRIMLKRKNPLMKTKSVVLSVIIAFIFAIGVFAMPQKAMAADTYTCVLEDGTPFTGDTSSTATGFQNVPTPVAEGYYSHVKAVPPMGVDPNVNGGAPIDVVCTVPLRQLGSIQLVDEQGNVLASTIYKNDLTDVSRAAATAIPAVPAGYKIVAGQNIYGYNAANSTVDPNHPADADAIGKNTVIRIERISQPTPQPQPQPAKPETPATPEAPKTEEPKLAETGSDVVMLAGAVVLATLAGIGAVVLRKKRA